MIEARKQQTLTVDDLPNQLARLHKQTSGSPFFNPVSQLGYELSRGIENEDVSLENIDTLVRTIELAAFEKRAQKLNRLLQPITRSQNSDILSELFHSKTEDVDWNSFSKAWQKPAFACVFTGHPTFMLSSERYETLAHLTEDPTRSSNPESAETSSTRAITLDDEHNAAMKAIARAQTALQSVTIRILEEAQTIHPSDWRELHPCPFSLGTWIGYDMDGRTDIPWTASFRFRLAEKQNQLERYVGQLENLASDASSDKQVHDITEDLRLALNHTEAMHKTFSDALDSPDALSTAANSLTAEPPPRSSP